jgi:hypothetical protein
MPLLSRYPEIVTQSGRKVVPPWHVSTHISSPWFSQRLLVSCSLEIAIKDFDSVVGWLAGALTDRNLNLTTFDPSKIRHVVNPICSKSPEGISSIPSSTRATLRFYDRD